MPSQTQYTYKTRHPHGPYPAGSNVLVQESPSDWRTAELQFEDGSTLLLDRTVWWFPGTPLHSVSMMDEICRVEDELLCRAIDDAVQLLNESTA